MASSFSESPERPSKNSLNADGTRTVFHYVYENNEEPRTNGENGDHEDLENGDQLEDVDQEVKPEASDSVDGSQDEPDTRAPTTLRQEDDDIVTKFQRYLVTLRRESSLIVNDQSTNFLEKMVNLFCKLIELGYKGLAIEAGTIIGKVLHILYPLPKMKKKRLDDYGPGADVFCIEGENFHNNGETVKFQTAYTFFPKTINDVQNVVKFALRSGRRIRASGLRHSWTSLYVDADEILISMLPLTLTDTVSHFKFQSDRQNIRDWNSRLSFIEFIRELERDSNGKRYASVKVGAATTNLELLEWSKKKNWTLPMNIIAVMVTAGGANATICHGAGWKTQSLSDLVLEMEFVNVNGEVQTVTDPDLLKSAAGCLGLLGVVVSLTLKMDYMTYAKWQPKKSLMENSIPRPDVSIHSKEFEKMVNLCKNSYFAEFFWFPNNGTEEGYWENCFTNDGFREDSVDLNTELEKSYQSTSTYFFDAVTDVLVPLMRYQYRYLPERNIFTDPIRRIFSKLVGQMGINAMPEPEKPITTTLVEALHFRQGFHYLTVRAMEMQIPIPSNPDGTADWRIVSRAWWDAVDLIRDSAHKGDFACDLALEMRIIGNSDVTLAPYRGNKHGTVSIEPVSTAVVPDGVWKEFKDSLASKWASYKDYDGIHLKVRPHWAKEHPEQIIRDGKTYSMDEYLKLMYGNEMYQFADHLKTICRDGGYQVKDLQRSFSNQFLDQVFKNVLEQESK